MTFSEYIKHAGATRAHNVEIYEKDCHSIFNAGPHALKLISLKINEDVYQYLLTKDDNHLKTMDEFGNPEAISCFVWMEE